MKTHNLSINSKTYKALFDHCQKQYKNIQTIERAYLIGKQVFGIDYMSTSGINQICTETFKADSIINFK